MQYSAFSNRITYRSGLWILKYISSLKMPVQLAEILFVPQFSMTQHRDLSVQKKGFASMSFISPTFLCLHVPQSLFKNFSVVLLSTNALVA